MKKYLAVVSVALVLSACGGDSDSADRGVPQTTLAADASDSAGTSLASNESPVAESEPAEMTMEDAAARYVEMATPANCASRRFSDVGADLGDEPAFEDWVSQGRPIAAEFSDAMSVYLDEFSAADWPAEVQPIADRLAIEDAEIARFIKGVADANSEAELLNAQGNVPQIAGSAGSEMLAKLKLPSTLPDGPDTCG